MANEASQRIQTYREFWPYYLSEHSKPATRWLHFVGTSLVFILLALSFIISAKVLWAMPVAGYFFAWVGHFGVEKNRPATFQYPLWSLIADFHMYGMMLLGKLWSGN